MVAPLALDQSGEICNVNADDVAAGLAGGLQARLVLLTDTDGVRDAEGRRIPSLDAGGGRGADRRRHASPAAWSPRSAAACGHSSWRAREAVIADGAAHAALSRALDDPAFGTRLRAEAGSAPAQATRRGRMSRSSTAIWTHMRFSAWSRTTLCGPSSTSDVDLLAAMRGQAVHHERVAARRPSSSAVTAYGGKTARRSAASASWPMLAQTSV